MATRTLSDLRCESDSAWITFRGATWQAQDMATMRSSPLYLGLALSQALTLAGFLTLMGGLGAPLRPPVNLLVSAPC